jgi:hypothetical protein
MPIKEFPSGQFPTISGQSGKYLTTNGSNLSWGSLSTSATIAQIATGSWTSGTSLEITSLSGYDRLRFRLRNANSINTYNLNARINSSSSALYEHVWIGGMTNVVDWSEFLKNNYSETDSDINMSPNQALANNTANALILDLYNCKESGFTMYEWTRIYRGFASSGYYGTSQGRGIFKSNVAVSSLQIVSNTAMSGGVYTIWGA